MTRQEELTQQLAQYAEAYYDADAPRISDADYDALEAELLQKFRAEPVIEVAPVVTEPEPETKDKKHKKVEVKDA